MNATAPTVPPASPSTSSAAHTPRTPTSAQPAMRLDDKYRLERGSAFLSGIHALVRLPMLQQQRDALQGKRTAGFVSGYRGSPLGGYDQALWGAAAFLKQHDVVFQPGVNEELAATAVWGTQQLGFAPAGSARFDGVFGLWYGKGPGVDRCADVFKHANLAGTTPWGGAIAVAGDDHVAKSSTAAHQSDHVFKACGLPVFFPASVQEILDLGIHAWAMSRYAGVWAGMKTIQEIVESSATAQIDPERVRIKLPTDFEMPPGGVHIRWPDAPLDQEARLMDHKWYAALAYIRANRLNHNVIAGTQDRFGIIASGKAYNDTMQALHDLGLDVAACNRLGIRVHKVGVVWPLEAQTTRAFAAGLREILVVEEKRQVIEYQIKEELYNWRADVRPDVLGKFDDVGADHSGGEWSVANPTAHTLLRANADLSPSIVARAIARRLQARGLLAESPELAARIQSRLAVLQAKEAALLASAAPDGAERKPWFCSGCPHNTSTRVPEGSRAMAGIGCHYMAIWMDRHTDAFTQMGGEGVPWVGQQPFTNERHIFANLGDGTYFHSGILAIRQSIAAGVNITYKLLYNDAVAMTGGQPVGEQPAHEDGGPVSSHSVQQIAHSLLSEGVKRLVVVTDEPQKYAGGGGLPPGVPVEHRDRLDTIQLEFRELSGTTVILYDQTCATEKRRRRKRGSLATPAQRVFINELVCEGCGDCSEASNCLSVEPLETEFGRKRTINQSSCNLDFSCLKGFCPSFVTVEGAKLRRPPEPAALHLPAALTQLPEPVPAPLLPDEAFGIVVAGVGGTGVITIGQLLGVAAHLEGKAVITQDAAGLAQKGGATWSHVLLAETPEGLRTTRVSMASADLILGCDPIVSASVETVQRMQEGRTRVALNAHASPTAAFVHQADWINPAGACERHIQAAVGPEHLGVFDAQQLAEHVMGDAIFVNPMVLGYAWQRGWLPLALASLRRAIELNGVAVARNLEALEWGRRAAHDPVAVQSMLQPAQVLHFKPRQNLEQQIERRVQELERYQNAAYAQAYLQLVRRVQQAEAPLGRSTLSAAVARNLYKLMAIKDEYEVARLYTDGRFAQQLAAQFEGDAQLSFHLAPPWLSRVGADGRPVKRRLGAWMLPAMRLLARLKGLRGTVLDVFAGSADHRAARALLAQYRSDIEGLLPGLDADRHAQAVALASVPDSVRGFGPVRAASQEAAMRRRAELLQATASGEAEVRAA